MGKVPVRRSGCGPVKTLVTLCWEHWSRSEGRGRTEGNSRVFQMRLGDPAGALSAWPAPFILILTVGASPPDPGDQGRRGGALRTGARLDDMLLQKGSGRGSPVLTSQSLHLSPRNGDGNPQNGHFWGMESAQPTAGVLKPVPRLG